MKIDKNMILAAVYGGAFLGGGGGGWIKDGIEMGNLALQIGIPEIKDLSELSPNDQLCTVGLVGAPKAEERYVLPIDFVRAVQILMTNGGLNIR